MVDGISKKCVSSSLLFSIFVDFLFFASSSIVLPLMSKHWLIFFRSNWLLYWAFPEKNCTPRWGHRFFLMLTAPGFSVKFTVIPLEFSIFFLTPPGNPCFFLNFGVPPWNSNDFYSTPWNFSLISSTGGLQFFLEKPIHSVGIGDFLKIKVFFHYLQ